MLNQKYFMNKPIPKELRNISGVYRITHLTTQRYYIGKTNNFQRRWQEHKYDLKKGKYHNDFVQNAYNKYGINNWVFEILEITPNYHTVEKILIKEHISNRKCMNLKDGEEVNIKQQKPVYQYDKNGMFIAKYISGNKASQETGIHCNDIWAVAREKQHTAGGYIWSYIELSEIQVKNKVSNIKYSYEITSKIVYQFTLDDKFVAKYKSASEACRQTGINHISCCAKGKLKTAGGYKWKYA